MPRGNFLSLISTRYHPSPQSLDSRYPLTIPTVSCFTPSNPSRSLSSKKPLFTVHIFKIPFYLPSPSPSPHTTTARSSSSHRATMAAALQQTPVITFQSRSPPSAQSHSSPTAKLSLFSTFKPSKLTIKPLPRRRRGGGALGARMSASAAVSYANALVDVARSNNTLEQTSADAEKLEKFFSDEAVLSFFTNPTISEETKRGIVDEIAKSSALQPHVANFLNILLDMKRIDLIKEIVKEFELVCNTLTGTEMALVTSVVPLEAQHLSQIAKEVQKLTGAKNVRVKTVIDPGLVAGFTIRYGSSGSKLIDMSVKKQLEEIAEELDLGDIQLAV